MSIKNKEKKLIFKKKQMNFFTIKNYTFKKWVIGGMELFRPWYLQNSLLYCCCILAPSLSLFVCSEPFHCKFYHSLLVLLKIKMVNFFFLGRWLWKKNLIYWYIRCLCQKWVALLSPIKTPYYNLTWQCVKNEKLVFFKIKIKSSLTL